RGLVVVRVLAVERGGDGGRGRAGHGGIPGLEQRLGIIQGPCPAPRPAAQRWSSRARSTTRVSTLSTVRCSRIRSRSPARASGEPASTRTVPVLTGPGGRPRSRPRIPDPYDGP